MTAALKKEAMDLELRKLNKFVTRIQALVRGVAGRKRFKKLVPALKRLKLIQSLCCECERVPAVRLCRNCKDQFCVDCFNRLHKKGNLDSSFFFHSLLIIEYVSPNTGHRKKHDWDYVAKQQPPIERQGQPAGGIMNTGLEVLNANSASNSVSSYNYSSLSSTGSRQGRRVGASVKDNSSDWEEYTDERTKRKYYHNPISGETTWINPLKKT